MNLIDGYNMNTVTYPIKVIARPIATLYEVEYTNRPGKGEFSNSVAAMPACLSQENRGGGAIRSDRQSDKCGSTRRRQVRTI